MAARTVTRLVPGYPAVDGAGVHLVRVLGSRTIRDFDPFLLLDAFDSERPEDYIRGFPLHPHRGIETVTYLLDGEIRHRDSLGNKGAILSGGCQWMTAGRSILHEEMPQPAPRLRGLQLWINLPKVNKMAPPKYRDITPEMIPFIAGPDARIGILCGEYQGKKGAMQADYVPARFLDVKVKAGHTWEDEVPADHTVFAYTFSGETVFGEDSVPVPMRNAALLQDGDHVKITAAGPEDSHFVLISGPPLREPVAWGGPIVMNTDEELKQAFFELENGTFIRA